MRTFAALALLLLASAAVAPSGAQEVAHELPAYTDAERWNRAATLFTAALLGDLADDMRTGMTPEESGRASAAIFGPPHGWTGTDTPFRLLRAMHRNWMSHPAQECELLEADEDAARIRCNRPWLDLFGDDGEAYGVTVEDFEASLAGFAGAIAEHHRMVWQQEIAGGDLLVTVRRE